MVELVAAVCMIGQPSTCKDVHLNFESDNVSTHQCMMFGQAEMAKWVGENPDWSIRKWRCGLSGQFAKL